MHPSEYLVKYPSNSLTSKYWHRLNAENKTLCGRVTMDGRKGTEWVKYGEMTEMQLHRICRKCLTTNAHVLFAEKARLKAEGLTPIPFNTLRPPCPHCVKDVTCQEARENRLKWWRVGKLWKCFGCGRKYKPEEIETTAPLQSEEHQDNPPRSQIG